MSQFKISRRGLIAGSAALALTPGYALAQEETPYSKWFKYKAGVERSWSFRSIDGATDRLRILPLGFEDAKATRVMALYPRASSAYDIATSKLLEVFDEKDMRLDILVVNYNNDAAAARAAVAEAEKSGTELIIAMGSDAAAVLWDIYRDGRIPVVTVCAKDPVSLGQARSYNWGSDSNFAFTSLNMPIESQMAYLLQVKPHLRNIGVLVDSTNTSAVETQAKPVAEFANSRGIRVLQLAVKEPANARAELKRMVSQAVATMARTDTALQDSIFWVTGSTSVFEQIATINAAASKAPVLSVVPEVVREGDDSAVLSIGVSFESNAHLAAIYVADVLQRRMDVGALKVGLVSPPDIAINFRRARAIGMRMPFNIFESAATVYDYDGRPARLNGVIVRKA